MSQIIRVSPIQVLDRRISKYSNSRSTKQTPLPRRVKLQPLKHYPQTYSENSPQVDGTRKVMIKALKRNSIVTAGIARKKELKTKILNRWKQLLLQQISTIKRPDWTALLQWKGKLQRACKIISCHWKLKQKYRQLWKNVSQRLFILNTLKMLKTRKPVSRETKIEAVRKIENNYLAFKHKEKVRALRKYLWQIPYESRQLFIKFQDFKSLS